MFDKFRRAAAGSTAAALVLGGIWLVAEPPAFAATAPIHIFTFNDFHGRLDGTAGSTNPYPNPVPFIYTIENAVQADPGNSLVISGGDNIGASEFASAIALDNPTVQVLNDLAAATPFVASAVGNHEFDQGFADLTNRINGTGGMTQANWAYLAANVTNSSGGIPAPLAPYFVYTMPGSGVKVGIVGAVTQETPSLASPAGIAGLKFGDPVAAVNKWADYLKSNGLADIVLADYHEGAAVDTSLSAATSATTVFAHIVADTDDNVAAIINGHTHMQYNWTDSKGRPVVQANCYGAGIADIELTYDTTSGAVAAANSSFVPTADSSAVNPSVGNMADVIADVNAALTASAVLGQKVVGKVQAPITTAYTGGQWLPGTYNGTATQLYATTDTATRDDRANESALGTLAADSFLYAAKHSGAIGGADIGIINAGGGLRAELPSSTGSVVNMGDGTVTYADANNVLPFGNNMWTIELTGAQIKQFLEEQWQSVQPSGTPARPFLNTAFSSNVTYTVNSDVPTDTACTLANQCGWHDSASHVTSVFINGVALNPTKTYKIITLSYLTESGDNYWVMAGGKHGQDTGLLDRDAWVAYLQALSGITATNAQPTKAIAPSFARPSVVVSNLSPSTAPMASTVVAAGDTVSAALSRLDMTSLGSPANTTLTTYLAPAGSATLGRLLGTTTVTAPGDATGCAAAGVPITLNPASNGCAKLAVTIPLATRAGQYVLISRAQPSGTVIRLAITVSNSGTSIYTGGTVAPSSQPLLPLAVGLLIAVAGAAVALRRSHQGL